MAKPVFTAAQAAQKIDRVALDSVPGWVSAVGAPLSLTYAFRASATAADFPLPPDQMGGFTRFTPLEIAAATSAMQLWSDAANIRLTRVGTGDSGEAAFTNNAEMTLGNWTTGALSSYASGWAVFYWQVSPAGVTTRTSQVWIDGTKPNDISPSILNGGYHLMIHEIGHGIGLSHPGSYNTQPGVTLTYAANAEYVQDTLQYTVMSYFDETNTGGNFGGLTPIGPMLHDIAAVQLMFGANTATRTGDTTYGFNSNADRPIFQATSAADRPLFSVWDGGGTNTFDFSGFSVSQAINLTAGSFSDINGLRSNVSIAFGTTIQNAKGGSGVDTIMGNAVDNVITGGPGNDIIDGAGGTNTAVYSSAAGNYVVTVRAGSTSTGTVQDKTGVDGTDTLTNIQSLRFAGSTVPASAAAIGASDADPAAAAGAAAPSSLDLTDVYEAALLSPESFLGLAEVYIGTLKRAPDALGMYYWASKLWEGASLADVARAIFASPEAQAIYAPTLSTTELVTAAYQTVLGRSPDPGGLAYWQGALQRGEVARDGLIPNLIAGAHAGPASSSDLQYLVNRATVGEHFALTQGLSDAAQAAIVMAVVDQHPQSVVDGIEVADLYAIADAAANGELIVKLLGIVA